MVLQSNVNCRIQVKRKQEREKQNCAEIAWLSVWIMNYTNIYLYFFGDVLIELVVYYSMETQVFEFPDGGFIVVVITPAKYD